MQEDILKVLYSEDEVKAIVRRLAKQVEQDYRGKNPLMICILKGAVVFMTDFVRDIDDYVELDFMDVSSYYGGTKSTGEVRIIKDVDTSVRDRDVVLVEDIIDTGATLKSLMGLFSHRGAKSVKVVALFNKPSRRQEFVAADYVGETVPDEFIVGYGLDYAGKYRNLPYIGILKPEVYAN
ncbi:hypoxanthine phosphoribosyltransferase [Lacticaseibacillus hulanensis]|uniref:hypoxanthine phosphoribosyltransferase n=1 Tax=Lacticaseibacillus hulanensis TaxID=2493111 RepID=UPI000FDB0861|nr:hypoxanthine phosphoribosyltransferase [Lacticaseibacillus hulanensis]